MFDQQPVDQGPFDQAPPRQSQDKPIILKASAGVSLAIAIFAAFFAFALARGYAGAATTAGRIGTVIFMGACVVLCAWVAIVLFTHRSTLTISDSTIIYAKAASARTRAAGGQMLVLDRASGNELKVITTTRGNRQLSTGLTIKGSGTRVPLGPFGVSRVRRACIAKGWQFPA
jgi:hypothetical protein